MVFSRPNARHRVLSAILLVAWLAHGIPFFLMTSNVIGYAVNGAEKFAKEHEQSIRALKEKGLSDVDVSKVGPAVRAELNTFRAVHLGVTLLGLGAGVAAFFALRLWRAAVVVTSAMYLFIWLNSGVMAHVSFIQALEVNWTIAKELGTETSFLREDVFVPLVLAGTILYAISDLFLRRKWERNKSDHSA